MSWTQASAVGACWETLKTAGHGVFNKYPTLGAHLPRRAAPDPAAEYWTQRVIVVIQQPTKRRYPDAGKIAWLSDRSDLPFV